MATRGFRMIQDENMNVNHGGQGTNVSKTQKKVALGGSKPLANITNSGKPSRASVGQGTNVSKAQKKVALAGSKPLANITNSGKPSCASVVKKNLPIKANDVDGQLGGNEGATFAQQSTLRGTQKISGTGGRRALVDISNSKKLLPHQEAKKAHSMRLDDIAEEGFLHNHQMCIDTMRRGMDLQSFDDDFLMELESSPVLLKSSHPKADFASPLRFMEYEDIPELLNEAAMSPRGGIFDTIPSPSPSPMRICYGSPSFELLMSP